MGCGFQLEKLFSISSSRVRICIISLNISLRTDLRTNSSLPLLQPSKRIIINFLRTEIKQFVNSTWNNAKPTSQNCKAKLAKLFEHSIDKKHLDAVR